MLKLWIKRYKRITRKRILKALTKEHRKTAEELEIGNRMFITTPREAFIFLKGHKEDFTTNPKFRLINPNKPEAGRDAMKILDDMVKDMRTKNQQL